MPPSPPHPRRPPVALLVATLIVAGTATAAAAPRPVALSPGNGTPDASPHTQLSILGAARGAIRGVRMTGAVSGPHPGRLAAYPHGRGASFLPATPFTEGERVVAIVRVRGRRPLRSAFTIARTAPTPPILNIKTQQPDKLEHFVSAPDVLAPRITVTKSGGASGGSIFLTPLPSPVVHPNSNNAVTISPVGPGGPMIIDGRGELVWFRPLQPPDVAANLRIQRFRGRRVLTWWQGPVTAAAYGLGEGVIADQRYRTIATVHAGNGYGMDIHEFTLTRDGDALFTVNTPVLVHLAGTPAGTLTRVLDAIVQEVDVHTGLVVWEWHALGHIPLADSYATPANSAYYDAFHINSIQSLSRGRILISARDTCAIYAIDRAGRILWRLGGKASDFRLGRGARFWFQHDAQLLGGDRVSLFDDEAGPPRKAPSSRALILTLDRRRHRATVARQYHRPGVTSAQSEGSVQSLPGGNVFAGFGAQPFFSEFSAAGRLVFDASLPADDGSYRVYRFPWSGRPDTRPVAAARRTGASTVALDVSWNGATGVRRWRVLTGSPNRLAPAATVARTGFETHITVTGPATAYAVAAIDGAGRTLSTSPTVVLP